jgi:hypothetical protein
VRQVVTVTAGCFEDGFVVFGGEGVVPGWSVMLNPMMSFVRIE